MSLLDLDIRAEKAEQVTWQGRQALRLENGLALLPGQRLLDGAVELLVGTEGAAYPGIAFRVGDVLNYELAYAVPHVSGQWDALQYDPVFHGSNTWQLYHGPDYQQSAHLPTGDWFRLKLIFCGQRAALSVGEQPPLLVERLAHAPAAGLLGLWTFRPAYFADLRVSPTAGLEAAPGRMWSWSEGPVSDWFLEGYGLVRCEPQGVLNLNRYLPMAVQEARLLRRFEMSERGPVRFRFGFSDALTLEVDDQAIFSGENKFQGFADRAARGYASLGDNFVQQVLEPGRHCLAATVNVSEPFGWGLTLTAYGEALHWLPAELG